MLAYLYSAALHTERFPLPFFASPVTAGFPSPADDYVERRLDLNELLITHPAASYFLRVQGESMLDAGINPGDIILVNRALAPQDGQIVIALVDGEFTLKRLRKNKGKIFLVADNALFTPLDLKGDTVVEIWGVVTSVIHKFL